MHADIELPEDFLALMRSSMPEQYDFDHFIASCKRPLRRSIRVNTLKISVHDFKQRARSYGWQLTPVPWCDAGFWLERPEGESPPLGNTAEHMAGLFYIQEASSMMPPSALITDHHADSALNTVLDVAAAPGSKTTQIASLMDNKGTLVANEFSASRVKILHANIQRCGVRNVAISNFDGRVFGGWLPEQFDAVLLDAPCSGEGAIRKDADAMKNWSLESITEIAETQKALLVSAFGALKPGGCLVYSTCTLNRQENQAVCHDLKQQFPDQVQFEDLSNLFPQAKLAATQEGFLHVFPQLFDSEGFFVARIRKIGSIPTPTVKKRLGKFPFTKATAKGVTDITRQLSVCLQLKLPDHANIWLRDDEVWLFPDTIDPLIGEIRFSRMGTKLAIQHKKGYRWQHEAVIALANGLEECTVSLAAHHAREWYMGRDVRPENISGQGEVIVKYGDEVIGLGKWVGNRIKNGLPRELVRDTNLF